MNLNERISKVISYSQLSSSEFADEIDVQRSNISHITSGRNKPSLDFLIKIKERFPELQWEWLITGEGEMIKIAEKEPVSEVQKPTPPPDLFSLIADENFGITEKEDKISKSVPPESNIPAQIPVLEKISDSQRLASQDCKDERPMPVKEGSRIKRIVWFFENGKFESFEP